MSISIWAAFTALSVDVAAKSLNRKPGPDNLEAVTLACYEDGKRITALELLYAEGYGNMLSRSVGAFFETVDALVTPTIARPPLPLGEINQNKAGHDARWNGRARSLPTAHSPRCSTRTGQPAISLPLYATAAGLPIGVQIAGRFGDEATLIRLASQLEQARPWAKRKPPVHVSA